MRDPTYFQWIKLIEKMQLIFSNWWRDISLIYVNHSDEMWVSVNKLSLINWLKLLLAEEDDNKLDIYRKRCSTCQMIIDLVKYVYV